MASAPFALEGDDPNISPDPLLASDVLTGSNVAPEPLTDLLLTPPVAPDPVFQPQGPGLNQPGFQYQGPFLDPQTGVSSYGTPAGGTAAPSTGIPGVTGIEVLDDALGIGKLLTGAISAAYASRTGTVTNNTKQSTPVAGAKNTTSGAGTSSSLLWVAIIGFVAIVFWLEFKSGH